MMVKDVPRIELCIQWVLSISLSTKELDYMKSKKDYFSVN